MPDFLLELRSEEIPARMQAKARDDLARLLAAELASAGLTATETRTYATPRRLALIARGLPNATSAKREEVKGPPADAPAAAIDGFLRKLGGVSREVLETRPDAKGRATLFAVIDTVGRRTAELLPGAIDAVIRAFPWPKSMRWGDASLSTDSLRWVRPLHGIVALFGDALVPVEIAGVRSGYATLGHRFHHPGPITIGSAADYVEKLRACHVLVDPAEREALIRDGARALAAEAGLALVEDEGLVAENAGLTEWPVPLLGRFDEGFLEVPPEVIQLTARVNQKYFVCRDAGGALANAFLCTANIAAPDGGAKIVEGNRKVLAARLADARFFYEQDLRTPLDEQAKKLDRIVFHEKLGTVADKVDRVTKLARWLVEEGVVGGEKPLPFRGGVGGGASPPATQLEEAPHPNPSPKGEGLADLAERAARLCKADLVTGMVAEFPELQGVMGGYYAAAQGEDPQVAAAIRDHYKPVGQGDEVPTAPVTVAVSLADKLDTLAQFFAIEERPTGSKDPFALRRAALGVIALLKVNQLRVGIVLTSFCAVMPRLSEKRRETERAPLLAALPVLTDLISRSTAEYIGRAVVAAAKDIPDPFRLDPELFGQGLRIAAGLRDFMLDRLEVSERYDGVRADIIRAAQIVDGGSGKEDDLVRLLARVRALQSFMATEDGANLLTGYRRAANILKKEGYDLSSPLQGRGGSGEAAEGEGESASDGIPDSPSPDLAFGSATLSPEPQASEAQREREKLLSYTPEPAEEALIAALDSAEPRAAQAVAAERFADAMAALASLRAPIDAFFDSVTVNDPDPAKRSARLALLARIRDAVHTVADFAKIEGS